MNGWLEDNVWVVWLVVALVLAGIEITTLDLLFLMLAVGAAAGAVTATVTDILLVQVLVAAGTSVAMLAVVRPVALRHLRQPAELRTGTAALVGRQGVVVERVDAHDGRVRLAGEIWSARAYDSGEIIEVGATVDIVQIDGATVVVLAAGN